MWVVGADQNSAWFYTEEGTDRLIFTVGGSLEVYPDQQIFDRVSEIPEPFRTAFVQKIEGSWIAEDAGEFDRMVYVRVPNGAEAYYGSGRYNGD